MLKLVDGHQWCSENNFISSIPSLNLLKLHSNSGVPPLNLRTAISQLTVKILADSQLSVNPPIYTLC